MFYIIVYSVLCVCVETTDKVLSYRVYDKHILIKL